MMKQVSCVGTPFEIGQQHGKAAKVEICRGLAFYAELFEKTARLSWPEVCDVALKFETLLRNDWRNYREEMQGEFTIVYPFTFCYSL